ncbi:DUF1992 domain-containing protein [Enterobacteriaceae bacterium ESL0689]|nr:DUF1992 domain-containing protein [Enterobacteriaceae bacterium ESL0689]
MWVLDQWAERHIMAAQANGEFEKLPGNGNPLILDDNSHVSAELRAGYRILKNAGYLPPELEQRKEAIALIDMLKSVSSDDPQYKVLCYRLAVLEFKLHHAGLSTDFLYHEYAGKLQNKINKE